MLIALVSALYANKINPGIWEDVNDVEPFGFLSGSLPAQVRGTELSLTLRSL